MSNVQTIRALDATATQPSPGATTTLVRADERAGAEDGSDLHPQLRAQLKEVRLRAGSPGSDSAQAELVMLLQLVSAQYQSVEDERRGIVQSMRLMADEARALAHEAREQSSEHLQVILDHIKDVVLTVDEEGVLQTFNPTGERVFGYIEAEVVGQRIDLLIPKIATHESVAQALQRLAASSGDTHRDLASRESVGKRKDGELFPAEIAVSKAPFSRREMFIVCLRDVTERRESEQAMRESEARYRLLVDHAPEAIVVFDADAGRFVDVNENAERLFGLDRKQLLEVGPVELSPATQSDGSSSAQSAHTHTQAALEDKAQVHEWVFRDAFGKEITCEVRLVRLPSGSRRLIRGSIADISARKRSDRVAAAERQVFAQLSGNASLPEVLASITRLIESVGVGTVCSISVLADHGQAFTYAVAPHLPAGLRSALERSAIDIRNGSCAAAVYLGRQVLVADVEKDPFWAQCREAALGAGLRAAWSTPIKASGGKILGSLGVYRGEAGLPTRRESETMGHAAQLAGIAIERRLAEEALRGSEAKFRGLFESIAEGVYQSDRGGRLQSVNPAFVSMMGYRTAEELYALPSVVALYWDPADRADFMHRIER
jgi:PAS domain S-box-containing protein